MTQTLAAASRGQGLSREGLSRESLSREGLPVVFLHGLGGSSKSWEPQLRNLGDRYHCIAPDLPGYGASPETAPMSLSAWADALARLFDAMKLDRVVLVGHSLGGMLAQEFMIDHAARVSKLLLSCTSPAFGRKDGEFQKQFISARLKKLEQGGTMRDVAEEATPTLFSPSASREAIDSAIATMWQVPEKTYRAALDCLVAFDRKEALTRIGVPTLLLSAEHDRAAPPVVMERMAEKIPHARHVTMSGLGHLPNIEAPERFDREVTAFIEAD
jgi:pimeloyl-ACP methyl ester carboxylesterase